MLRKIIQIADHFVNFIIAAGCILLLVYGAYALWDSAQISEQANSSLYTPYKPVNKPSFDEMKKTNPEIFGWLTVNDTHIDYPLVQSSDNSKYVNTDVTGNFSLSGSLFLDYRNENDFSDLNSIIYGHHMEKNAMFGELENFDEQSFFDAHQWGKLYYNDEWHDLEFFAFLHVDAYDPVIYNTEIAEDGGSNYLSYVKEHARHFRDLSFQAEDRYLVLSTCTSTSTNGRHVLIGRISGSADAITA